MKDRILIVTSQDEPNVPDVLCYLDEAKVFRINTDEASNYGMTLEAQGENISIRLSSGKDRVSLEEIKSVWYRRPPKALVTAEELGKEEKDFAENETRRFFQALWHSFPEKDVLWVNHLLSTRRLEHNKPRQLQIACRLGLKVPDTLVTNNQDEALRFWERHAGEVILKTFSSFSHDQSGYPTGVYTRRVERSDLEKFGHELQYAPVIFQNYVPKKVELRVTVVGKHIFACAIHSQDSARTKDDWRRYDFKNVKHEPYQLPRTVEVGLLDCMKFWKLQFGAIDMIVTPDEEVFFLEVNPSGHWGWIEVLTELPISKAIAELLEDPNGQAL